MPTRRLAAIMANLVLSVFTCTFSWPFLISFSVESCREAFTRSQGMVLFGSKLKLVPLNIDGKLQ